MVQYETRTVDQNKDAKTGEKRDLLSGEKTAAREAYEANEARKEWFGYKINIIMHQSNRARARLYYAKTGFGRCCFIFLLIFIQITIAFHSF